MRHKRIGRKLGVTTKHRKAIFRNMLTDLLRHEKIKTTDTRAKEIRRIAEKYITLAKKGTLHARRMAAGYVRDKEVLQKLFDELAARFKERPGGYTRIVKLGVRVGDNAPISLIELIQEEYKPKKKRPKRSRKKKAETAASEPEAKSTKKESAEELGLAEGESKAEEPEVKEQPQETEPAQAEEPKAEATEQTEAEPAAEELQAGAEETEPQASAEAEPEAAEGSESKAEPVAEDSEKKD